MENERNTHQECQEWLKISHEKGQSYVLDNDGYWKILMGDAAIARAKSNNQTIRVIQAHAWWIYNHENTIRLFEEDKNS